MGGNNRGEVDHSKADTRDTAANVREVDESKLAQDVLAQMKL